MRRTDSLRLLVGRGLPCALRLRSARLCWACILSRVQNWPQSAFKSYTWMRPVNSDSPGAVCKITVGIKTCAFAKYLFVCSQACCVLAFLAPGRQMPHKHRRNLLRNFMNGILLSIMKIKTFWKRKNYRNTSRNLLLSILKPSRLLIYTILYNTVVALWHLRIAVS